MNRELGMEVWYFSLRGATRRCLVVEGARWAHSQAKFEDLQCPSLGTLANTPNQLIIIIKIELPFKVSLIMETVSVHLVFFSSLCPESSYFLDSCMQDSIYFVFFSRSNSMFCVWWNLILQEAKCCNFFFHHCITFPIKKILS